ncbi:MAG TPA: hypothetical protein VNQ76_05500 [Planctomicrobium sp.]|nr:hypothetical protein [Planctomicrobium sp.]
MTVSLDEASWLDHAAMKHTNPSDLLMKRWGLCLYERVPYQASN